MGYQDRDYIPADSGGVPALAALDPLSVTTWLIALNVGVFVLDSLTTHRFRVQGMIWDYAPIVRMGEFTVGDAIFRLQLWRFITFQFLHENLTHLLFNMLGLFFFGPMIEAFLGRVRFLVFYLLCGVAGPVSYLFFYGLHVDAQSRGASLIGASAGVFGILMAAAQIAPNATVLIYGLIPARLRTVAWVLLGVAAYTIVTNGHNAGGEAAHLGGAGLGYLLINNLRWLEWLEFPRRRPVRRDYPTLGE